MAPKLRLSVLATLVCVLFILLSTYHYTGVSFANHESSALSHDRVAPYGVGLDLTTSYGYVV